MKNKKDILTWLTVTSVTLIICTAAAAKLSHASQLVEIYSKNGLLSYMSILGAAELVLLVLFLFRQTRKIGFLLLTAYYVGAMAVELSHGTVFMFPAVIPTFIWISAYLRDASLFKTLQGETPTLQ